MLKTCNVDHNEVIEITFDLCNVNIYIYISDMIYMSIYGV